jgi:hypothetical protein
VDGVSLPGGDVGVAVEHGHERPAAPAAALLAPRSRHGRHGWDREEEVELGMVLSVIDLVRFPLTL